MFFFILIGLFVLLPLALIIVLFGGGSDSSGLHGDRYGDRGDDYHFPSEDILQGRLKSGYYDDDPDMLELHDPDRYEYLYDKDYSDDYDNDDEW